jgi:hypothetical protein
LGKATQVLTAQPLVSLVVAVVLAAWLELLLQQLAVVLVARVKYRLLMALHTLAVVVVALPVAQTSPLVVLEEVGRAVPRLARILARLAVQTVAVVVEEAAQTPAAVTAALES